MSYSTSAKGKGVNYYQPPQHPPHRIRFPQQQRPEDISQRQPRFNPQQASRPQHPVPSQSPRVPSPSVSPVAVNTLPHDMNKQGAPSRPGMSASPQQGILPTQPNPGAPPMMAMNQVRYAGPRPVQARAYAPLQQQVYSVRHQSPQMQGMQHHPQAGGPGAQQGANTAQIMQSNAAPTGQYMQQGGAQYIMTGPVPIVQQIQHRPFHPQSYQQVYQPPTPPYYSSPPQQVWMNPPTPAAPQQRAPFTQQPIQQTTRPDSQRNKKIIRIVDPTTNQDVTDTLMRDASGSTSPHSGRSSANVTPPVSTTNEDAKRIQAQFAARVAMVASDIPPDQPLQQQQQQQQERPPQVQQQQPAQQPQTQPQQPPPPQQMQQPMPPPQAQPIPMQQQQQPPVLVQQIMPVGPGVQQVPVVTAQVAAGVSVPVINPGTVPAAVVPQGQLPSQPVEPSMPEAAQNTVVAATPSAEAVQPSRPADVQPVPKPVAPEIIAAGAVQEPALQQQMRMPAQQAPPQQMQPVPVVAQPPRNPVPVPVAVPVAGPPANMQTVPATAQEEGPAKKELPVSNANQDVSAAEVPEKEAAISAVPKAAVVSEAKPSVEPSANVQQVDAGPKQTVSSANKPAVQQSQPASAAPPAESQEPVSDNTDIKKKTQKKRLQDLDKKASKDSDELAAYRTDDVQKEPTPASGQDNPGKERDTTTAPDASKPKEPTEKVQDKSATEKPQPQTTQPEEKVKKIEQKTDDSQRDVAKRKSDEDVAKTTTEKPAEVVPETTPAKLDAKDVTADHDRSTAATEDKENMNEDDSVEAENSKNKEGKPNPKDNKIQLKYAYREDQWSPVNPDGKKQYGRDFLLQFQKGCTDKPDGLPNIPDIVLDRAQPLSLNVNQGGNQKNTDFMPHFMKSSPRVQGKQPNYPTGQGRRSSREPRVINRAGGASAEATKLSTTEKAWKPGHKREEEDKDSESLKTEEMFRSFTSILNKLTPQKFQKLVEQAQQLPIDTEERLKGVIQLVFEKAIGEPSFSTAYAHMCQRLSQVKVQSSTNPGTMVQFRPILLHNCQREFEKEKQTELDEVERRKEIALLPADQRDAQLELLNEKLGKAKRRTMGNIRFIGELYKLRILTENIMHDCIIKLLKAKDDESLECLCQLMATIGKDLDHEKAKNRMDQYFTKVDKIIQSKKNPPRIRFLLCDLVDLRKSAWKPRRQESKPTTIDAIHKEWHVQEAKKAEDHRNYRGSAGRSREQAPPPRTGPPQADDGWNTVPTTKTRTVYDPAKLKLTRIAAVDSENIQLGPGGRGFNMWTRGSSGGTTKNQTTESASASQEDSAPTQANRFSMLSEDAKRPVRGSSGYGSRDRDSRGRGQSPISKRSSREREREKEAAIAEVHKLTRGRPSRTEQSEPRGSKEKAPRPEKKEEPVMTDDKVKQKSKATVDEFLNLRDFAEAIRCISELPIKQRHLFVQSSVDHIIEKKQEMREGVGILFQTLIEKGLLTHEQYLSGISGMVEFADDMAIDIPKIYEYLGEIQGAMLVGGPDFLKLQATAIKPLLEMNKAGKLLAEILKTADRRIGASKVCHIWQQAGLRWEDFLPAGEDVQQFVQKKGLEFTLDGASAADNGLNSVPADSQGDWIHVVNRGLTNLLKVKPDNNQVLDWIEHNVTAAHKQHHDFIRALVTIICQNTTEGEGQNCRIDPDSLKQRGPVLQRYIDNKRPLELQALFAVQALNHSLHNPPGLLGLLFDVLYDEDVITEDSFNDWKKSEDPRESAGKGVALKSVTSFFTWLTEAE